MRKVKSPSDRAHAWAKKWADYNYPSRENDPDATESGKLAQSSMWVGFFTGACKGWWHGYQAGRKAGRAEAMKACGWGK